MPLSGNTALFDKSFFFNDFWHFVGLSLHCKGIATTKDAINECSKNEQTLPGTISRWLQPKTATKVRNDSVRNLACPHQQCASPQPQFSTGGDQATVAAFRNGLRGSRTDRWHSRHSAR